MLWRSDNAVGAGLRVSYPRIIKKDCPYIGKEFLDGHEDRAAVLTPVNPERTVR